MNKNIIENKGNLVYLPISELYPHPDNPRKELGDLTELAESIKVKGIMQNLTVVKRENESGYTIVIGHRRHGAAKLAGLKELPCVIVEMSAQDQVATMLLENMQRNDLTIYEQAQGFQMMLDLGDTIESIAEKSGFSQTTVRRRIKLVELDQDKLKKAAQKQISMADLDCLNRIIDADERNKLLDDIGTSNFQYAFKRVLQTQEKRIASDAWREKLLNSGLTEIPYDECHTGMYESCERHYPDCFENIPCNDVNKAINKLKQYEDEAEQREKGCGKCDSTVLKTKHPNYKFCPYCSRKLGD